MQYIKDFMRPVILSLLLFGSFVAAAQTIVNDPNAQVRSVPSFNAISIGGGIDLFLTSGGEGVAVSARTAEFREAIKTEVKNGVLRIWYDWKDGKNWSVGTNKKLKAYVSYNILKSLAASGGSDVLVDGTIKADDFSLSVSGGSDFKGAVRSKNLIINGSGGSDIDIQGRADALSVDVSGGSDFNGYGLTVETCSAEASGGSDISITVSKNLQANASGGSDVLYKGSADTVNIRKSGGSSVRKQGR